MHSFADLDIDMAVAEDYVKFCTSYVMEHNADDLAFFEKQIEPVSILPIVYSLIR